MHARVSISVSILIMMPGLFGGMQGLLEKPFTWNDVSIAQYTHRTAMHIGSGIVVFVQSRENSAVVVPPS